MSANLTHHVDRSTGETACNMWLGRKVGAHKASVSAVACHLPWLKFTKKSPYRACVNPRHGYVYVVFLDFKNRAAVKVAVFIFADFED